MSNISRQMRRRMSRLSSATPIGTAETMVYQPGKLMLSIRYGDATLNWHATIDDISDSFTKMNAAKPILEGELNEKLNDDGFKHEMRNLIILGLEENRHMAKREGNNLAQIAMWYMWLKRDAWMNAGGPEARIGRLTMIIEAGENRWFQFKWEIKFKEEMELPELERINVWTPFRADNKFDLKKK